MAKTVSIDKVKQDLDPEVSEWIKSPFDEDFSFDYRGEKITVKAGEEREMSQPMAYQFYRRASFHKVHNNPEIRKLSLYERKMFSDKDSPYSDIYAMSPDKRDDIITEMRLQSQMIEDEIKAVEKAARKTRKVKKTAEKISKEFKKK